MIISVPPKTQARARPRANATAISPLERHQPSDVGVGDDHNVVVLQHLS